MPRLFLVLGLATLVVPFNRGGIWDPHELRIAELARLLAIQLFRAAPVAWDTARAGTVTVSQLGQGELGVTSPALGFALFGVTDWAGRITSLFWGAVALTALWYVTGRLVGRTAQVISCLVLVSTPLFAWQSRSMLGDAATIGTSTLAIAACLLLVRPRAGTSQFERVAQFGLALVGLGGGVLCRGVLFGIGIPTLAVGFSSLCCHSPARPNRLQNGRAILLLGIGVVAGLCGLRELLWGANGYSPWLGVTLQAVNRTQPFDLVLGHFLHQTFPLCTFAPWAFSALFRSSRLAQARPDERLVSLTFACSVVLALVSTCLVAPRAGLLPFPAVAMLAGLIGILVQTSRRGSSAAMGAMTAVVMAVLLFADYINLPEKILLTTGVQGERLVETLKAEGRVWLRLSLVGLSAGCVLSLLVATSSRVRKLGVLERYRQPMERVRLAFGGQLISGLVLVETALGTIALLQRAHEESWISVPAFDTVQAIAGPLLLWLWTVPPLLLIVLPFGYVSLRGAAEWAGSTPWGRRTPGLASAVGLILAGFSLTLGHAPQLAEQLSPKRVAMQYREHAKNGERLALLGLKPESTRYYLGYTPEAFTDVGEAVKWLHAPAGERRWLSLREELLAESNAAFRSVTSGTNLVLLETPSSSVLLATNRLGTNQADRNPLAKDVLRDPPGLSHETNIVFGGVLRLVGWGVYSDKNANVTRLHRGKAYELRLVFRVAGTTDFDWQVFVHLDGFGRRHNGDHEPVLGRYPTSLWQPGDVVVDRHEIVLERTSMPGTYTLYAGLFRGNRRLDVTEGAHSENRVTLGPILVE